MPTVRKNAAVLRYVGATILAVIAWTALRIMPFYPPAVGMLLAVGIGAVTVFSPSTASLLFVCVVSLPVIGADLLTGVVFLIAGLAATQYLSEGRAGGFVLAVLGIAAIPLHAEWAVVALAGYLLGRERGLMTALTVCVMAIGAGVAMGVPVLGTIVTGGSAPGLVSFSSAPADALTFGWLVPAVKAADPGTLYRAVTSVQQPVLVGAQLVLWAAAALVGAQLRSNKNKLLALAGTGGAVALLAAGSLALSTALDGPVTASTTLTSLAISLPAALAVTAVAAWVFPMRTVRTTAAAAEPMDVDELLRTIASAEDELAARHNTQATVLITDMKSFSAMTEELGSVQCAKIVQRHRDLLLPIIKKHGGSGCATGGDGLVAAFKSADKAAAAAIEMQRALDGYSGSDRSPHELSVRVGVASGEVVLDAAGCPFLGGALNLAARVMDLADGGRVMLTGPAAAASGLPDGKLHQHGEFKLKNIADAVPVVELLWKDGAGPQDIRAS